MGEREHWERVYATEPVERLGWYEPHLRTSLCWMTELGLSTHAPIIDVGAGASTLVDDLLAEGYRAITLLDVSRTAMSLVKARLGDRADLVGWLEGDVTRVELPAHAYEVWHDRAVFHFLSEEEDVRRYRSQLARALRPGGHVVIGTFAPEAPPRCSGLRVRRYTPDRIAAVLGAEFELQRECKELHLTPSGVEQMYQYCRFRRAM